jgi:hypothetical protein
VTYYALDNGVWFVATSPLGVWRVSDVRPTGVEQIPRLCPVYRAKFVYIYQTAPAYVYEGYLPDYDAGLPDGCAMAETYDQDWMDAAWGYDLDFVFGWGGGWYNGYYRFDNKNRYYGHMVYNKKQPGWHEKEYGPSAKSAAHPHPPGGWGQRTGGFEHYAGVAYNTPATRSGSNSSGGGTRTVGVFHGMPPSGRSGVARGGYSGGGARGSFASSGGGVHVSSGGGGAVHH